MKLSCCRYEPQTLAVHVSFDAATFVNFTLVKSPVLFWSNDEDFGIRENIQKTYLTNQLILDELRHLSTLNSDIMEYNILSKTLEGWSVPMVHLSKQLKQHEKDEPHILLIGSLHGDDPVTTEMLMRFIRHILQGEIFNVELFKEIYKDKHISQIKITSFLSVIWFPHYHSYSSKSHTLYIF